MGIGLCFLFFLAEKLHSRVVSWKDAGSRNEVTSLTDDTTNFRYNYASFANSLAASAFFSTPNTTANPMTATTTDVDTEVSISVNPANAQTSALEAIAKRWSRNMEKEEEDDTFDKAQLEQKLRFKDVLPFHQLP